MNIHPRKREPDKSVLRDILRLLKPMALEDFNQKRGYFENFDPEGEDLLNRATDVYGTELKHLMHQHGAPLDPFSSEPWDKRPYDVLQPLFSELLGEEIHA